VAVCRGFADERHATNQQYGFFATVRPRATGHWLEASGSTSVSVFCQGGESPPQVGALRLVADRNCDVARRGGEYREANGQSATQVNSIRPGVLASLLPTGEAQTGQRKPVALRGSVSKQRRETHGGWRRNGWKAKHMKQRDLPGARQRRAGVRASIVATKPGNAGGAKGRRKMDVE